MTPPRTPVRLALALLAVILAVDLYLFRVPPWGFAFGAAAVLAFLFAALRPQAGFVVGGAVLGAVASASIVLPRYDAARALLLAGALALPLLAALTMAARLRPVPGADAPSRALRVRFALVASLAAAILAAAALMPGVRAVWASEAGAPLAALAVVGAGLVAFGPLVLDRATELRTESTAAELKAGTTVAVGRPVGGPPKPGSR